MTGIYSRVQPIIIITAKVTIIMETAVVCAYVYAGMPVCVYAYISVSAVCVSSLS